jgi:hypothetical protein
MADSKPNPSARAFKSDRADDSNCRGGSAERSAGLLNKRRGRSNRATYSKGVGELQIVVARRADLGFICLKAAGCQASISEKLFWRCRANVLN